MEKILKYTGSGILIVAFLLVSIKFFPLNKTELSKKTTPFKIEQTKQFQTIHNFGTSDAWATQFVGKYWPSESKEKICDLLFSTKTDNHGNPLGIGLTAWRFNIGSGSAGQGSESNIGDEWHRAECFLDESGNYDWNKQAGQQWFLKAAKDRGVEDFVGFVNSPPVFLTKNGKAWSADGISSNLKDENYKAFADFLTEVAKGIKTKTGVNLDYISPFNEPQWEWKCCKQEGSPWDNDQIARFVKILNESFEDAGLSEVKIEITEAATIEYLNKTNSRDKKKNNQIEEFFNPASSNYLGNLKYVAQKIAGHSYFTTWDVSKLLNTRKELVNTINKVNPDLEYWMSEYCILEDNEVIIGKGQDLGIDAALYMARIIQADLIFANASAWHWWLAVSPYDYKDGLIYIDKKKDGGEIYESKMLWAMGNFSRFIRPGAKRISIDRSDNISDELSISGLIASAYQNSNGEIVVVFLNQTNTNQSVSLNGLDNNKTAAIYITSGHKNDNLRFAGNIETNDQYILPERSIVTFVIN